MGRGQLRIYLGAAPGVGKTYAMLNEGWRRHDRGTDVVVGFVETHGRTLTAAQLRDLEVVPRCTLHHKGAAFEEMDVDAVLARAPDVALVDELAHTNVPGSRNDKRWQDVEELLDAGITVISTVNIQHLESVNDVVADITGVEQRETVPDAVVRAAEQIEIVDMAPEAIRRRMAHGNIYPPERVDAALANYFRPGNLTALRELALLWVADRVDTAMKDYRERHGIEQPWETRERVVVAITGGPGGDQLVRRAARIAQRSRSELLGVHVTTGDGLAESRPALLDEHRELLTELSGDYHEVAGSDVSTALVEFARAENATQLVLGETRRSRLYQLLHGSIINEVIRHAEAVDVHVIAHESAAGEARHAGSHRVPRRRRPAALPARRVRAGWLLAVVGVPAVTLLLHALRHQLGLPSVLLLYLILVVAVATLGGIWPAMAAAVTGFLATNWFFTPPVHTWTIAERENVLALLVFLGVAAAVSAQVWVAARRTAESERARAGSEALASLTGSLLRREDPIPDLIDRIRTTFGLDAVAVLRRADSGWEVGESAGTPVPGEPAEATNVVDLGARAVLGTVGTPLSDDDLRVLSAFAAQVVLAMESRALHQEAAAAETLAETNALRTALLSAVSHDLRTPLASIKAAVTSLRQGDVDWPPEETDRFLAAIDAETDRLNNLVGNLLDMSRIQTSSLAPLQTPVGCEEVVAAALASLGNRGRCVEVEVPETLPRIEVDPALLERAVANVVDNAIEWSAGRPVRVEAAEVAGTVHLRVVDRGPGIPGDDRERVFQPFQQLGDNRSASGVGLGMAVARGFVEAMKGEISLEDTPGGGLTVVFVFPAVQGVRV